MKKFFLLLFFFVKVNVDAQNFYNQYFFQENIGNAIPTYDGGFAFVGGNFTDSTSQVSKFDSNGANLWNIKFKMPNCILSAGSISEQSNRDLAITAVLQQDTPYYSPFLLMRIDSSGNLKFGKSTQDSIWLYSIEKNPTTSSSLDGNILLGSVGFIDSLLHDNAFLSKIDFNGNPIWTKLIIPDANTTVTRLRFLQTTTGNIVVTGSFHYFANDPVEYYFFQKLDTAGNILWSEHASYPAFSLSSNMDSPIELNGDYFIPVYSDRDTFGGGNPALNLYKIDSIDGHLIWHKYFTTYSGNIYSADNTLKTSDGRLLLTLRDTSQDNFDPCVVEIDSGGNVLRNVVYSTQTPSGMFYYDDLIGNFEATGGKIISYGENFIFASVDSLLHPACQFLDNSFNQPLSFIDSMIPSGMNMPWNMPLLDMTSSIQTIIEPLIQPLDICMFIGVEKNNVTNTVTISPNPFHASAKIEIGNKELGNGNCELRIFNTLGVLVRTEHVFNITSYLLHRNGLSDGLYFYELTTPDYELLGTGKFIIE